MEYMGNQSFWDEKFRARGSQLMQAEQLLVKESQKYHFGKKGLELACGDGRNLIWLMNMGCEMTGIDFSIAALDRVKHFAETKGVFTELQADLSQSSWLENIETYEFIIINHYRLVPILYKELIMHLEVGGYFWVNGFAERPNDNPTIGEEDILRDEDYEEIQDCLIDKYTYEVGGRQFVRYLFQRKE